MNHVKKSTILIGVILIVFFITLFNITDTVHQFASYLTPLVILLTAFWARGWIWWVTALIVSIHIVNDVLVLGAFPTEAIMGSLIALLFTFSLDYALEKRHEAKKESLHQQDLLEYIIHHNKAGVAVHDKDLNYIYVSDVYLKQYNVNREDVIGRHHYEVFPDLPQKWRDVHQRVLKGAVESADRDAFPHEDGSVDYTRWEARPWYLEDGSIGGLVIYTEIINDQLKIERDLENSRNNLLRIMDNLPIGVAVHTIEPYIEFSYINEQFTEILGLSKEKLMEEPEKLWNALYKDKDERERVRSRIFEDLSSLDMTQMRWLEVPFEKDGGTRYFSAYSIPLEEKTHIITTLFDVTEQKLREEDIIRMSETDHVTGMPNRKYFSKRFEEMDDARRYPLRLMLLDINGLKLINDAFGFESGTNALKKVGGIIKAHLREGDVHARVGSDDFAVLMPETDEATLEKTRKAIIEDVSGETIGNMRLSISTGTAFKSEPGPGIGEIYSLAEDALYKQKVLKPESTRSKAIDAILATLGDKFEDEKKHSERVASISYEIGRSLGLGDSALQELRLAGMLHDIGKISTPDDILGKPGRLDEDEWEVMKDHAINGYNILRTADEYSSLALYALTHHEHYDGSGYPQGMKGEDIPMFSRIIAVADAFEAMTSDRPYRKRLPTEKAIETLYENRGTQFDPDIVEKFHDHVYKNPGIEL